MHKIEHLFDDFYNDKFTGQQNYHQYKNQRRFQRWNSIGFFVLYKTILFAFFGSSSVG